VRLTDTDHASLAPNGQADRTGEGEKEAMGLFGTKKESPGRSAKPRFPPMGSGRRLSSALGVADTLSTLDAVVSTYRPQKYAALPLLIDAGFAWLADPAQTPKVAVSCEDAQEDFLLVALIDRAAGTEIGLFPLGSGDARLTLNIVGHWKQQDSSLSSTGTWPAGTIALRPPRVPLDLAQTTVARGGYPLTDRNLALMAEQLFTGILVKAGQFVSHSDGDRASQQFVEDQGRKAAWSMDALSAPLQSVVDDLSEWNPGVLPYIQDLPWRVSAVFLEGAANPSGTFWGKMDRT
jgi:hypothetical protein